MIADELRALSADADCRRRRVGAVLVREGQVLGRGYNALPGGSCLAGACPRGLLSYADQPAFSGYATTGCTAIHAEHRAILDARAAGHDVRGAVVYVTDEPCPGCVRRMRSAGIVHWDIVRVASK